MSLIVVFILLYLLLFFGRIKERQIMKEGNELITMIDDYIQKNGKAPKSLGVLGVIDTTDCYPFDYTPLDSISYIITILQDSNDPFEYGKTYYSDTKEWRNERYIQTK